MADPINPEDVVDFDQPLNTAPMYSVTHVFSTNDIVGTFEGLSQGEVGVGETPVIDFAATPRTTNDGVDLYPINSEFGFNVFDFDGAVPKDFVLDPDYLEGFAGDLKDAGGAQLGLVISDAPTDTFKTPALLGTWLSGIGGNTVKASTEHYTVMQHILSDQLYPGDPDADYPLDDALRMIGGEYDGQLIVDILPRIGDVNGDGQLDVRDALQPNESTITENIAASTDYSVTLKDDGKLLYRWGNAVKRPNDVRVEAELPLPTEWKTTATPADPLPLFKVTQAELVVHHTITNNPNDQIRPEDFENEAATGTLPTHEILPDGRWVTTDPYYAGDGTLYPAGTVLRDPALATAVEGSDLDLIGGLSADLEGGFTNAWYTTMDREPFEPTLTNGDTEYEVGPRWRLKPNKYGQDLPSIEIPLDPSLPPPPTKDQIKYEVGAETQTVINLLDWANPTGPLSISAGWMNTPGLTTVNGVNLTDNFDLSIYVKGDVKPATLYSAELVMDYEAVAIAASGQTVAGGAGVDYLAGQGGNDFTGGGGEDLFVVAYGSADTASIASTLIQDFVAGVDMIGLIDLFVNPYSFGYHVTQALVGGALSIMLDDTEIALLNGQTDYLTRDDFLILNPSRGGITADTIIGSESNDELVGDGSANTVFGLGGDDIIIGADGEDWLYGDAGADILRGGDGNDVLLGGAGDDRILGGLGDDVIKGGLGNDVMRGNIGAELIDGGDGSDTALYNTSSVGVTIDLDTGTASGGTATGDVLTNIERLIGSFHGDTFTGTSGNEFFSGLDGDDVLIGGDGQDVLRGGLGADDLQGGDGVDTADYRSSALGVTVNLSANTASGGEADGDTFTSIEGLLGSEAADTFTGSAGNDRLMGSGGDDVIDAGAGIDMIEGGLGDDTLTGGADRDRFVFRHAAFGQDTITDWQDGIDYVDARALGISFSDFVVTQNGADALLLLISDPLQTLTFQGIDSRLIGADDFL